MEYGVAKLFIYIFSIYRNIYHYDIVIRTSSILYGYADNVEPMQECYAPELEHRYSMNEKR